MREIAVTEVWKLKECVQALSEYHNEVSVNFKGYYPSQSYEKTLDSFSDSLRRQKSRIAVIEKNNRVIGFCKIDLALNGKLDYLMILKDYRGKGYGKELMDWAMKSFTEENVRQIEVKVVDGNAAIHLYEKYGFKMNAHILVNIPKVNNRIL